MTFRIKEPEVHYTEEEIKAQLTERRPLPIGRQEFLEWSDRIISGALLPASIRSQRFALADMILHLGPTEDHKEDAFFIHCLRKTAVNQVAVEIRQEVKDEQLAEVAAAKAKAEKEAAGAGSETSH